MTRQCSWTLLAQLLVAVRADSADTGSTMGSAGKRELITVEGAQAVDSGALDPDDFLWEKLPGRCCFYGGPDPMDASKWLGAHTCDECSVWDLPNNFCHTSASACHECGMQLYCNPTPPLIAGNVVCTGTSRVGQGCEDALGTGVCATHSLSECQEHCRGNARCEMLVFYPQEKQGTCILCADLAHTLTTTLESTRVYGTTPAPPPPGVPRAVEHHYQLLSGPSPPPPPRPPPSPPARPPRPLSHLGRHHTRQHFECKYQPQTEFGVDQSTGYTDRRAGSKEECCNLCGIKSNCQDFVFEPASSTCVLLPHVPSSQITRSHNEYTVSGSLQITVVKASSERHGECDYQTSSGYAGGSLGAAKPLPGGAAVASRTDCCDACDREPRCAKFTYETYSKTCMLFQAYAEHYITDGLLSGIVTQRSSIAAASDSAQASSTSTVSAYDAGAAGAMSWMNVPPPPTPPNLRTWALDPPPSPPPVEFEATKIIVADVSVGIASLMGMAFCVCAYCFFREDLISAAHKASGRSARAVGPQRGAKYGQCATDDDPRADGLEGGGRSGGKRGGGKGRRARKNDLAASSLDPGQLESNVGDGSHVHVRLETTAITQKRQVFLGESAAIEIASLAQLRERLCEEFGHALKGKRPEQMLMLCEASAEDLVNDDGGSGGGAAAWHLITTQSDLARVLARGSLKLIERPKDHVDETYTIACPIHSEATQSSAGRARGSDRAGRKARDRHGATTAGNKASRSNRVGGGGSAHGGLESRANCFSDDAMDDSVANLTPSKAGRFADDADWDDEAGVAGEAAEIPPAEAADAQDGVPPLSNAAASSQDEEAPEEEVKSS